jgi:hypothetical protein
MDARRRSNGSARWAARPPRAGYLRLAFAAFGVSSVSISSSTSLTIFFIAARAFSGWRLAMACRECWPNVP